MKSSIKILLSVLGVILTVFFIFFFLKPFKKSLPSPPEIKVPEEGEVNLSEEIAVPQDVLKTENTSYRNFSLSLEKGSLNKKFIYAYQNDIITIKFSALDNDYKIEIEGYNLNIDIQKDSEKMVQFQAVKKGNFNIICENCQEKIIGLIIVK